MPLHTYADTFGKGRGRGRGGRARGRGRDGEGGRSRGRSGRGRGRGRGRGQQQPEEEGFQPFSGSGASLLGGAGGGKAAEGQQSDDATGVFQEREAMANYHEVMVRKQEELNALAALEMAERQQREQAERERLKREGKRSAEQLARQPPAPEPSQADVQAAVDAAAAMSASQEAAELAGEAAFSDRAFDDEIDVAPEGRQQGGQRDGQPNQAGHGKASATASAAAAGHAAPGAAAAAAAAAKPAAGPSAAERAQAGDVIDLCVSDEEMPQAPQQQQTQPRQQQNGRQQPQRDMRQEQQPCKASNGRTQQSWQLDIAPPKAGAAKPSTWQLGFAPPPAGAEAAAGPSSTAGSRSAGDSGGAVSNPFMSPARYIPEGGEDAVDLQLYTREVAEVADLGMTWHRCSAILDTGNEGCTLITQRFAARLGLLNAQGQPLEGTTRTISMRGVVAGASERVPIMSFTYRIKGKTLRVRGAMTTANLGCDLLVSRKEILQFESDGYRLSARL